jgi:hypothetical protein
MSDERVYYSHDAEVQAMRERTVSALVFLTLGTGDRYRGSFTLCPQVWQKNP